MNILRWAHRKPHGVCAQLAHELEESEAKPCSTKYCAQRRKVVEIYESLIHASDSDVEQTRASLQVLADHHAFEHLVTALPMWQFEGRKDVVDLFTVCIEKRTETFTKYVCTSGLLHVLTDLHNESDTGLICGLMFRDALKCPEVAATVLNESIHVKLISHARNSHYDIAADAWLSLKHCLTQHKRMSNAYIDKNFDKFFQCYHELSEPAESEPNGYVTQRQSLKLLSDMLLDPAFVTTMLKYTQNYKFLKMIMNALRSRSKIIRFEAFHVFKMFAANPKKPPSVHHVLWRNKDRLLEYLGTFLEDERAEDEQFQLDHTTVMMKIRDLEEISVHACAFENKDSVST